MSRLADKVVDGAHAVRLEFDDPVLVPRLVAANHFASILNNDLYRYAAAYNWDRAIPYRRVVLCPRFTLNLSTS